MTQALTQPFPLRLTAEERANLDRVFEIFQARRGATIPNRTTRTDIARMALDRGLQALLQDLGPQAVGMPAMGVTTLPHDEAWMTGGAMVAADLLPPFDWGTMDPAAEGDPILVVPGRGAFAVE
jgi:hypothetical protein